MCAEGGVREEGEGGVSHYQTSIKELLKCSDVEARAVEALMRDVVFHSTLDWQSNREFNAGARKAQKILAELDRTDPETAGAYRSGSL